MDFSLDGQWVVYAARENGTLWKSRIDGSNRVQLMSGATGAFAPHWSPDQKEILFTGFLLDKQPRLYVVSAQGGSPKPVLPRANRWASVSGDWHGRKADCGGRGRYGHRQCIQYTDSRS
jgi:Tol biopolymer transport system component